MTSRPPGRRPPGRPRGTRRVGEEQRWPRYRQVPGSPIATLPIVATIGANGLSDTGANLIGSVNPQGASGFWGPPGNLVSNPSFEYDTVDVNPAWWAPPPSGPVTLTTSLDVPAVSGTRTMKVTNIFGFGANGADGVVLGSVASGTTYVLTCQMRGAVGGELAQVFIGDTRPFGQSDDFATSEVATLTTTWQEVSVSWSPAKTYRNPTVSLQNPNAAINLETFYVDNVSLNVSGVYADGDDPGYGWTGTSGNSPTMRKGTWAWLVYGTDPLGLETFSSPFFLADGLTTPETLTFAADGLTPGTTYYFAAVGSNGAGTVYDVTDSFVAAPPSVPVSPATIPVGQPLVTIPHFDVPVTFQNSGMGVVEQDSLEEVLANVVTIVLCPVGACPQLPTFGRSDVNFAQEPVLTDDLVADIQQWEPRASEDVVSQLLPDGLTWGITLTTSSTGARQT